MTNKDSAMYYLGKAIETNPEFAEEWKNTMMQCFYDAWDMCGIKTKKEKDLKECIEIRCKMMLDKFIQYKDWLMHNREEIIND